VSKRKAVTRDAAAERGPLDELHGQEPAAVSALDRVDGDDVWMNERGGGACLHFEPAQALGARGGGDLDRDIAAKERVVTPVQLPHPAGSERRTDDIMAERLSRDEAGWAIARGSLDERVGGAGILQK